MVYYRQQLRRGGVFDKPIDPLQFQKVQLVRQQLIAFSGFDCHLVFLAKPEEAYSQKALNKITLSRDFLVNNTSIEVIAGILAHEWGHLYDSRVPTGRDGFDKRRSMESFADHFSARFLAFHQYRVAPFINFCIKRPEVLHDEHGGHYERASQIATDYGNALNEIHRAPRMAMVTA